MADGEGTRWLRYGCFGCLALGGAVLLIVGSTIGIAALRARSEQPVDHQLTRPLPATREATSGPGVPLESDGTRPGRVVLDLGQAEFRIAPGDPGEPIRVEASYDESSFELVEEFEPGGEESGWVYRVTFHRTGGWLMTSLQQAFGGTAPTVQVLLPPDAPIALELTMTQGALKGDLGGLWITAADIDLSQGGFELGFDTPLRVPMERLHIDASMGGGVLGHLGNASPARLDLDVSMGGLEIDLRGEWIGDSDIGLRSRMASAVVRLPRDVRVVGIATRRPLIEEPTEIPRPTLTFEVDADDRGKLEIVE